MKLEKLRCIREANRRAIVSRFEQLEEARNQPNMRRYGTLLRGIEETVSTLKSLNDKIVDAITEMSELEVEILDTDTYTVRLQLQIDDCRAYIETSAESETNDQSNIEPRNNEDGTSEPRPRDVEESRPTTSDQGTSSGVMNSGVMNSRVMNSGVMNSRVMSSGVMNSGVMSSGVMNSGVMNSGVNNNNQAALPVETELEQSLQITQEMYQSAEDPRVNRGIEGIRSSSAHQTVSNQSYLHYHSLPKLSLPTFSGNVLEWQSFWDSYDAAVHSNPHLLDVQKFNYLKAQLEGDAARAIAGFTLTNANYLKALDLLRERFGRTNKIVQAYMKSLLQIPAPSNTILSLRQFYDHLETFVRGLESLEKYQESYGELLVPVIIGKLPVEIRTRLAYVNESESWSLNDLRKAINRELRIMETVLDPQIPEVSLPTASFFTSTNQRRQNRHGSSQTQRTANQKKCVFCDNEHLSQNCATVRGYDARVQVVKRKRLCFNCLGPHQVVNCKSHFKCNVCQRKHHTSICPGEQSTNQQNNLPSNNQQSYQLRTTPLQQTNTSVFHATTVESAPQVLLKTAIAPVCSDMYTVDVNILFDEGAQSSFITDKLANELQVKRTGSEIIHLASFGESSQSVRHMDTTTVNLKADNGELIPLHVLIVPTIAVPLSNKIYKDAVNLPYLRGLKLAHHVIGDDTFDISILIGANHYWQIVGNRIIRGNGPTAVSSKIGFLLSGPFTGSIPHVQRNHVMNVLTAPPPVCDLERFWKLESLGISEKEKDIDNTLDRYKQDSITFKNNRYIAKLPWKPDHRPLPTNYDITKRRTESTIKRLQSEPVLLQKYGEIINEQERRGFVEKVPQNEESRIDVHYIPHHAVRKDSVTTPIRIVYDCSCRQTGDQPSLNECLESTPPQLNDLTSILLRFRYHEYAVATDIEKAFLHVVLHENDRDYTRFLWLSDPTDPDSRLQTYRFRSVLFGATCSPFILNATILRHLDDNSHSWVSEMLKRDLYVDNILTALPRETDAMKYFKDSRDLMSIAGFNLRSWTSNSARVREAAAILNVLDSEPVTKLLGMRWNVDTDEMLFADKLVEVSGMCTKREILKQTARVFDPLGLLGPVTIRAKILLQDIWRQDFSWDTELPQMLCKDWADLVNDLNVVMTTKVQRHYFRNTDTKPEVGTSLHIFVDASQNAYGATAYLCRENQSTLIMAKNRVAPLKTITLPRLELMAAVIGVRLAKHIQQTLPCIETHYWSDSQIVLHWIKSLKPLNRFIANRVKEIRNLTKDSKWRYCPTDQNPADLQTRGVMAKVFKDSKLWWNGPRWLVNKDDWPTWEMQTVAILTTATEELTPEVQPETVIPKHGIHHIIDQSKYSRYIKLLRITAYVYRFIHNCKREKCNRSTGPLNAQELRKAEVKWIQNSQELMYGKEMLEVKSQSSTRSSVLRQLRLFLDNDNILRCEGRIHNAPLDEETRFPILLPAKQHLTNLIIQDAHERALHSGENATITQVRQKFWVPRIRQCVKSLLRKCVTCKKVIGRPYVTPKPPPLVKYRVQDSQPFTVTGVDFTGALHVKDTTGRQTKVYICLFTCAATRAIHLEVVPNMTEEAFIQAFRRFTSRRSVPQLMVSDNATTFQAAANHVRRLTKENPIYDLLSQKGTEWRFIPKRAPWFGGYWERLIGLTKTSLKKVLGKSNITLAELQTVVTEIEAILNDRPLTYTSSNVDDPEPLTPAHLLYGRTITSLPYNHLPVDSIAIDTNRSSITRRADMRRKLIDHFRDRWTSEYLTSLREHQQINKRTCNEQPIVVGEVVQIHEDRPRAGWKLGVITELTRGNDGLVRSAKIRTVEGTTNRPVTKLYPLEVVEK